MTHFINKAQAFYGGRLSVTIQIRWRSTQSEGNIWRQLCHVPLSTLPVEVGTVPPPPLPIPKKNVSSVSHSWLISDSFRDAWISVHNSTWKIPAKIGPVISSSLPYSQFQRLHGGNRLLCLEHGVHEGVRFVELGLPSAQCRHSILLRINALTEATRCSWDWPTNCLPRSNRSNSGSKCVR